MKSFGQYLREWNKARWPRVSNAPPGTPGHIRKLKLHPTKRGEIKQRYGDRIIVKSRKPPKAPSARSTITGRGKIGYAMDWGMSADFRESSTMKSFGQFLEWTAINRPKSAIAGKRSQTSLRATGADSSRTVSRVDHGPIDVRRPREYSTSELPRRAASDGSTSGRDTSRVVQPHHAGMSKIKGVFASDVRGAAPYSIPREQPWAAHSSGNVYVNREALPKIERHPAQLSTFRSDRFQTLPTSGERISDRPGKPVSTTTVRTGELLRRTGQRLRGVKDVGELVRRARRRGIQPGKVEGID